MVVIVTRKLLVQKPMLLFFILCVTDGILVNIFKTSLNIIFPKYVTV